MLGLPVQWCHLPLSQPRPSELKALLSPQMKCSHRGLPRRAQNLCRTEQRGEFTSKPRSPAEIQKANSQVGRVPMETLEGSCPQRKVMSSLLQRLLTHSELPTRRGISEPSLCSALGPSVCCHREHLFLRLNEDTRRCCDSKNKH